MYLGGNFVLYSQDELSQKNGYSPPLAYNARENEDFFLVIVLLHRIRLQIVFSLILAKGVHQKIGNYY